MFVKETSGEYRRENGSFRRKKQKSSCLREGTLVLYIDGYGQKISLHWRIKGLYLSSP